MTADDWNMSITIADENENTGKRQVCSKNDKRVLTVSLLRQDAVKRIAASKEVHHEAAAETRQ